MREAVDAEHAAWLSAENALHEANETVESLRAERDEALAEMEEVGAVWRQEQIMHQKAWATIRNLQAEVARLRDTHVEAEAARGRCKPDRVWHRNDPEPDGVNRVTDIDGDEWGKANGKWRHPHAGPSRAWANLIVAYGPLTEVISR